MGKGSMGQGSADTTRSKTRADWEFGTLRGPAAGMLRTLACVGLLLILPLSGAQAAEDDGKAEQPVEGAATAGSGASGATSTSDDQDRVDAEAPVDDVRDMPRHLGDDTTRLGEQKAAASFLDKLSNEAFTVLNASDMADDVRHEAFRGILSEGLAVDFIGRLMLGSHRRTATEEQLRRYEQVFPDYITRLYASQLAKLAKVRMQVVETEPINDRDVRVRTNLFRENGDPIVVDWRVRRRREDQFQIIDIFFEGVSIVLTKRDEFNALVRKRGFDALLAELQLRTSTISGVL